MSVEDIVRYPFRGVDLADVPAIAGEAIVFGAPLVLLRALVPMPQAVRWHLCLGLHIDKGITPPIPVPGPRPFIGMKFVGVDVATMIMGPALARITGSDVPAGEEKVHVYGLPAARAGGKATGLHIPIGPHVPLSVVAKGSLLYGSASVDIEGHHAVRLAEMATSCSAIGVDTPTSRVITYFACGGLVVTGGTSVLDPGAAIDFIVNTAIGALVRWLVPEGSPQDRFLREYTKEVLKSLREVAEDPAHADEHFADIFLEDPVDAARAVAEHYATGGT